MNKNYLGLFLTAVLGLPILYYETNDLLFPSNGTAAGVIFFIIWIVLVLLSGVATFVSGELSIEEGASIPTYLNRLKNIVILLAIVFLIPYKNVATFHNTANDYKYSYEQKCKERPGFYDAMWKTYSQKNELKDMNEATFIRIAETVMSARKDGANLSWKWVQESTQIPFNEFTEFYKDLSAFIEKKRDGYFDLEKQCQVLAYTYNAYLKRFPNNVYNVFLGKDEIEYHYGFISDSTKNVFLTKIENLPLKQRADTTH
jgi:hypothetical protein